jgi:hypothetical protein
VPRDGPSWPEPQHGNCVFLMDKETHMTDRDFETDRGSGAIITAFAVLAIIALAAAVSCGQGCRRPGRSAGEGDPDGAGKGHDRDEPINGALIGPACCASPQR